MWQTEYQLFMSVTFAIATLFLVCFKKFNLKKYIAAMICGFISTFSFGIGLLLWPVGFIGLLFQKFDNKKSMIKILSGWALFSLFTIGLYKSSMGSNHVTESVSSIVNHPTFIKFIMTYLGSMFITSLQLIVSKLVLAAMALSVIFTGYKLYWQKKDREIFLPFVLMNIFAIGSAILTAYGRNASGTSPYMGHYVAVSCIYWISVVVFLFVIVEDLKLYLDKFSKTKLFASALLYFSLASCLFMPFLWHTKRCLISLKYLEIRQQNLFVAQKILKEQLDNSDILFAGKYRKFCPYPRFMCPAKDIKTSAEILKKYNLSLFKEKKQ